MDDDVRVAEGLADSGEVAELTPPLIQPSMIGSPGYPRSMRRAPALRRDGPVAARRRPPASDGASRACDEGQHDGSAVRLNAQ